MRFSGISTSPTTTDPYGSQLFTPSSGSTRNLFTQAEEAKLGKKFTLMPCLNWNLSGFARDQYAPLLLKPKSKVAVMIFFLGLLGLSLYGTTMVHDGLYLTDVVPRDTKEYNFINAQFKYFSFYNMYLVTMDGFDYTRSQKLLMQLHDAFNSIKYVVKDSNNKLPNMWLHYFQEWLKGTNLIKFVHPPIFYLCVCGGCCCWSLSQLPLGERRVTPWQSPAEINGCPLERLNNDIQVFHVQSVLQVMCVGVRVRMGQDV